jgi:hypothetical protein
LGKKFVIRNLVDDNGKLHPVGVDMVPLVDESTVTGGHGNVFKFKSKYEILIDELMSEK